MTEFAVTNPATGERLAVYAQSTQAEIESATTSAHAVYRGWASQSNVTERATIVGRVADLHRARQKELARIIVREMGKPIEQALGEVDFAADIYRYYADNGETFLADEPIDTAAGGYAVIRKQPLGPLLGIMPWNFPYYQVARFAGPNIVIGNPILLKHAEQCPESALAIEQIFTDAGAPAGVYTNLFASHDQLERVIADPRVRGVSLTGSERAGARVAELAGRNLKKVVLELGGSDPFLVLDTNDLDDTVAKAVAGRLDNTGQACNASKRFIVLDEYYDEFLEKYTSAIGQLTEGTNPSEAGSDYGPLSSVAAADNLAGQLTSAVDQGAVLVGGERHGAFISPGLLTNITEQNDVFSEELFGPVAQLYRVGDVDEAVELANNSPYGLGATIISENLDLAEQVANRLEAGMVFVNEVGGDSAELPFGGVKRSGSGRELGRLGIEEFVNQKLIRIRERPAR